MVPPGTLEVLTKTLRGAIVAVCYNRCRDPGISGERTNSMTATRIGQLPAPFCIGKATVEPLERQVTVGRRRSRLSPRALQLLLYMASKPGQTVPHDELINAVWGGVPVGDEVLFKAISELRRALDDSASASRHIATIPKVGYRLLVTPQAIQHRRHRAVAAPALALFAAVGVVTWSWAPWTPSTNDEASRLTSKALYVLEHGEHGDHADGKNALDWLKRAAELDPLDAGTQALLGKAFLKYGGDWPAARKALDTALQLDPDHVLALMTRARIALEYEWQWASALQLMERAKAAEPDNPMVYVGLAAWHASTASHTAATACAQRAVELDPVSPVVKGDLAFYHFIAGDHPATLHAADQVLELQPDDRFAIALRLEALLGLARVSDARQVAQDILRRYGASDTEINRLRETPDAGFEAAYLAQLQVRIEALPTRHEIQSASILARQGNRDAALQLLWRALESRSTYMPFVPVDPHFRSLHGEPQFRALLQEIGHPLSAQASASFGREHCGRGMLAGDRRIGDGTSPH